MIVDSIDGRVHHLEFEDPTRIEEARHDMIVEAAPEVSAQCRRRHTVCPERQLRVGREDN
jgi:hypothetical protein